MSLPWIRPRGTPAFSSGVMTDALGALGEDQVRLAAVDDGHQHGRAHERSRRHDAPRPPVEPRARHRHQVLDPHEKRTDTEPRRV